MKVESKLALKYIGIFILAVFVLFFIMAGESIINWSLLWLKQ